MRRRSLWLLLLAAGCGTPGPGDELLLLSDAQERSSRDLLAFYYSETQNGTQVSIVVPRAGDAEFRSELGTREEDGLVKALIQQGHISRRRREFASVSPEQRNDLVARFAALPPGESEWTLPLVVGGENKAWENKPGCVFGPEIERRRPLPSTLRMVLASPTGELQTVVVFRGNPKGASASAKPGGESVSALEKSFQAIFLHPSAPK